MEKTFFKITCQWKNKVKKTQRLLKATGEKCEAQKIVEEMRRDRNLRIAAAV
jgi:hypothetical protein